MVERLSGRKQQQKNQAHVEALDGMEASLNRNEKLAYISSWEKSHNYFFDRDYKYNMLVNQPKDSLIGKLNEIAEWRKVGGVLKFGGD